MTIEAIKSKLATIPKTSGVYQFFDDKEQILYVGKAKNLQKRVTSYTKKDQLNARIARMVFLAKNVEITQTESELEALLLEHNLIKKLQPRFNILLRDDKTFAQILLTDHKFPLIRKHRGVRPAKVHILVHLLPVLMLIAPLTCCAKLFVCAIALILNSNRAKNRAWNIKLKNALRLVLAWFRKKVTLNQFQQQKNFWRENQLKFSSS